MSDAERLRTVRDHAAQAMDARRRRAELGLSLLFLLAALALGLATAGEDTWPPVTAVVLVVLFALTMRVQVVVGLGYTTPVQLVFVPMLLLLPAGWVPLLVCAGWLLGRLPDLRHGVHPDRLLVVPASCWFAVGPALVLVAGGATEPDWADWPLYVAALGAQIVFDLGFGVLGDWLGRGRLEAPPLRAVALSPAIDVLLSPLGLLAAVATDSGESFSAAYLLLLPPVLLLGFYARERTGRLDAALALADAAKERERLIAIASHELNTPLGVMTGLHDWLGPHRDLPPERRAQAYAAMGRELQLLRQLVRQFSDFTALRTERPLRLDVVPVPAGAAVARLATTLTGTVDVVAGSHPEVAVHADADRLDQALLTLARHAMRGPDPVRVDVVADRDVVRFEVRGPATPDAVQAGLAGEGEGEGLELYVVRRIAQAQDGDVSAAADPAGCLLELRLPLARTG